MTLTKSPLPQLEGVIQETGVVPAVNQVERHPRIPNLPLVEYCAKKNIIITAYSAFGNNSVDVPLLVNTPEVKAIAERLSSSAGKTVTPAQVILAWSQLGGHVVIPKSVTASRIRENFQEADLDDEAIAALKKLGEKPQRFNVPMACTFANDPFSAATRTMVATMLTLNLQTNPSGTSTCLATIGRRVLRSKSSSSKRLLQRCI